MVKEKRKKVNLNIESSDRMGSTPSSEYNTQELLGIKKLTADNDKEVMLSSDTFGNRNDDNLRISVNDDKFAKRLDANYLKTELGNMD